MGAKSNSNPSLLTVIHGCFHLKHLSVVILIISLITVSACAGNITNYNSQKPERGNPAQEVPTDKIEPPQIYLRVLDYIYHEEPGQYSILLRVNAVNLNPITYRLNNLQLSVKTESGINYISKTIPDALLEAHSGTSFDHTLILPTDYIGNSALVVTLNGVAISSDMTTPFNASANVNLPYVLRERSAPVITINGEFGPLTQSGLNMKLESVVKASDSDLFIATIKVIVKDLQGREILRTSMEGGSIAQASTGIFTRECVLPIETLNKTEIIVDTEALAQVGRRVQLLRSSTKLFIPGFTKLIPAPKLQIENYEIKWISAAVGTSYNPAVRSRASAAILTLNISIENNSDFNLSTSYFGVKISSLDLASPVSKSMMGGAIPAHSISRFTGSVYADFIGYLGSNATIKVESSVGMDKVNEMFPVSSSMVFPIQ